MWTPGSRARRNRGKLLYQIYLTDDGWVFVAPPMPTGKHGGRKCECDERDFMNGIISERPHDSHSGQSRNGVVCFSLRSLPSRGLGRCAPTCHTWRRIYNDGCNSRYPAFMP
jgi:hypothetical protein